MEGRAWENLNSDCLVNVFRRLDLESKLLDIPFVCKQWHQALLNPLCWQELVFPVDVSRSRLADASKNGESYNLPELIKFVISRSQGSATRLELPNDISEEDLIHIPDVCPNLKTLALPNKLMGDYGDNIPELIVKWKRLELLRIGWCSYLVEIIDKISVHCKKFNGLFVVQADVDNNIVSAIVSKLATIKLLRFEGCVLDKVSLVQILRGCRELELLWIWNCVSTEEEEDVSDEEILRLTARIKDFQYEGCRTVNFTLPQFDEVEMLMRLEEEMLYEA